MVMRSDCGFVGEKNLCRERCTCSKLWLAVEEVSLVHTDWALLTLEKGSGKLWELHRRQLGVEERNVVVSLGFLIAKRPESSPCSTNTYLLTSTF